MNDDAVFEANWLEEQLQEIFGATEVTNLIQVIWWSKSRNVEF